MKTGNETNAPKKSTNLTVDQELLAEARRFKINISATLERALAVEVKTRRRQEWLAQNKESLEACNRYVDKHGLFSDDYRVF